MSDVRRTEAAAVSGLAALLFAGAVGRAVARPLWHDEVFTLYIAEVPTSADLWRALAHAVDLNPPLYHLSVRASAVLFGPGPLATRLPAVIGFIVATLAIYAFCRRRVDAPFAWLGAVVLATSGAYAYAYEGRPYGLVLGSCALALLAWQVRDGSRWARVAPLVCAIALAGAFWTHYYALLMVVPLACGELVRTWRRRFDWPMWAALVVPAIAGVPLLPLIRAARQFAGTFWSRPEVSGVSGFYEDLIAPLCVIVLVAALAAWVAWLVFGEERLSARDAPGWSFRPEETIVLIVLFVIPLVAFAIAVLVTGAFHERYVLYAGLALPILSAGWAHAGGLRGAPLRAFLVVMSLAFAARQGSGMLAGLRGPGDPLSQDRALLTQTPPGATVVVSHALTFVPLVYYGASSFPFDVMYLARPPALVRELGVDTGSRALQRLAAIAPVHVSDLDAFVSAHQEFYVYGPPSWLMPYLLKRGVSAELLATAGDRSLHRVRVPRAGSTAGR